MLSAFSYMVDYFRLHGLLRWTRVLSFMAIKAGLIIAVFMHMAWERMALICATLLPPLVLIGLMSSEASYTWARSLLHFGG